MSKIYQIESFSGYAALSETGEFCERKDKFPPKTRVYVLPPEFDPEINEVLIVQKNAMRVWIEGYQKAELLHGKKPDWDGATWYSEQFGYVKECVGPDKPVGVDADLCVEFVAVETRRPPDPEKPVRPRTVTIDVPLEWAEQYAANPFSAQAFAMVQGHCKEAIKPFSNGK